MIYLLLDKSRTFVFFNFTCIEGVLAPLFLCTWIHSHVCILQSGARTPIGMIGLSLKSFHFQVSMIPATRSAILMNLENAGHFVQRQGANQFSTRGNALACANVVMGVAGLAFHLHRCSTVSSLTKQGLFSMSSMKM